MGHWPDDEVDWGLALRFNEIDAHGKITLTHLSSDGWVKLVDANDEGGVIEKGAVDAKDDDPRAFAESVVDSVIAKSPTEVPEHVRGHFVQAVEEWACYWRGQMIPANLG